VGAALVAWPVGGFVALAGEHPSSEHPRAGGGGSDKAAAAGAGLLDGHDFAGMLVAKGQANGDPDTIEFKAGHFVSTACIQHGFGKAPYVASKEGDVVSFSAVARNEHGETMTWKGTVEGGAVMATALHRSSKGETEYVFKGPDTAGGAATTMEEEPPAEHPSGKPAAKPEHPEHPR
jgi:hypothetical protein